MKMNTTSAKTGRNFLHQLIQSEAEVQKSSKGSKQTKDGDCTAFWPDVEENII